MPATWTAPSRHGRLRSITLREQCVSGSRQLAVDRDAGIIKGVKILGLDSVNGRRYTLDAIHKAAPLYEGRSVNIDHPKQATDQRSAYDRFGRLVNVRVQDDGLYGDLEYLKAHPMAERICEAAERMPEAFGLSHNAQGRGETRDGVFVVEEITEVRHVDLVADPATTKSLSESRNQAPASARAALLRRLLEMDELAPDAGMSPPAPVEGDWKQDLVAAIGKLVQSEDEADHVLAKKIMAMLKPESAAPAEGSATEEEDPEKKKEEEERAKEGRDGRADPTLKQLLEKVAILEREKAVRDECDAAGIQASKILMKALVSLTESADRKALIQETKTKTSAKKPVSQGPGVDVQEARQPRAPKDKDEFLALIRAN